MKQLKPLTSTIVKIALLSAIATVLMYLQFPIFPAADWIRLDFSLVACLIGGFLLGPIEGVIIIAVKILLYLLLHGTYSIGIGELANFVTCASMVLPASLVYLKNKTKKGAIISLAVGSICLIVVATLFNYFVVYPLYFRAFTPAIFEQMSLIKFLLTIGLAFNLISCASNSLITFFVYKRIGNLLKKF